MNKKQNPYRVLSVSSNPANLEFIRKHLSDFGLELMNCSNVEQCIGSLEFGTVDVIIIEKDMPLISGIELLRYVKENFPDIAMMITGFLDVDSAVMAIKAGAEEYLVEPFNREDLVASVQRMLDKLSRQRKTQSGQRVEKHHGIVGDCAEIKHVFSMIDKAAKTMVNVMVSGDSGTGKELVARAIHYNSDRSCAPFVSVNCTAIPDTLLESELFGHVKGAFTGAKNARSGFFQIAEGGTIFLDEIGDASLNMQGKLLRVLQNKEIHLVGSSRVRKVDTRIIAATHKDLKSMVAKGMFREDLYYRLDVIDIKVPPLAKRGDDVLLLLNYFVRKFAGEMNRQPHVFTDNALQTLRNYHWPGNVRELENLVQRLVVIVEGDSIRVADLPPHMRDSIKIAKPTHGHKPLATVELEHIQHVLTSVNNNKTKASKILGIDRKTLRKKLQTMAPSK